MIYDIEKKLYYLIIDNTFCEVANAKYNDTLNLLGYDQSNIIPVKNLNSFKDNLEPNKRLNCPIYNYRVGFNLCKSFREKVLFRIKYNSNYLDIDLIETVHSIGYHINPSIIPFNKKILLIRNNDNRFILTNHHFKELSIVKYDTDEKFTSDDVNIRIILKPNEKDSYLLVYTYIESKFKHHTEIRTFYYNSDDNTYTITSPVRLLVNDPQPGDYVPFTYEDEIYFITQINPLQVIKLSDKQYFSNNKDIEIVETIDISNRKCRNKDSIYWDYGEMSGGTPAVYISDYGYLAFFHSIVDICRPQYFMGAYIFSDSIPFKLLKISYQPIINRELIIDTRESEDGKSIIYPMSFFLIDEFGEVIHDTSNDIKPYKVILSLGFNDTKAMVVTLNFNELLSSLISVDC